ncbi:restriction endonuclease subunit S [Flagellimonas marinaquae]|uniref:restriction endonuclease subunit S n=1 Tax=Flagellimonas marinaquae TaxID=254955 RepID=UPI0020763107|nr:restriction endonuclease subunit S [Allomuricauda aquimarina]USD24639.1 restriction endonuclease subunit S [Allomuricauda aquimarina]
MEEQKRVPKLRFAEFSGEWNYEQLENHIDLLSGYAFKGDDISEDKTGTPLLRGINITEGHIRHSEDIDRYYTNEIEKLKKYILKENDLVLGMDGSKVGKNVALINVADEGSLLIQRVSRVRAKKTSDIRFIYLNIFSSRFHRYVDVVNTSSGIPHISAKQIKEFKIGFPSLTEQQKIASFLSSVDKKIAQLQQKQCLLEDYKKGVIQKILSYKKRLEKFKDDEIRKGKLKDFGYFYYGKGAPKSTIKPDAETPCVRYGELYSTYGEEIKEIKSFTNVKPENLKFSKGGEVLVPRVGEDPLDFANCSYLPLSGVAIGEMISVYNTAENGLFLTYYINSMLKKQLAKRVEGGNVSNLYFRYVEEIEIAIPSVEEQTQIANFLSAIDTKIAVVSTQIEKTQKFKKGLLQQMFV